MTGTMSEQLCSVLVTVSVEVFLHYHLVSKYFSPAKYRSRSEGHGDAVLVAGHEVGVAEVPAGVGAALVLGAVVAVPVSLILAIY